jgi:hypothetical protein
MPIYRSGTDDLGNQRVDFVWGGTLPMQPAYFDRGYAGGGIFVQPGDGENEFWMSGRGHSRGVCKSRVLHGSGHQALCDSSTPVTATRSRSTSGRGTPISSRTPETGA